MARTRRITFRRRTKRSMWIVWLLYGSVVWKVRARSGRDPVRCARYSVPYGTVRNGQVQTGYAPMRWNTVKYRRDALRYQV